MFNLTVVVPFPASALGGLDFHRSTGNSSAGDTVGGVVLARDQVHDDGERDLDKHGNTDGDKALAGIVKVLEAIDQATAVLRASRLHGNSVARVGVFLLQSGDVEKATVGGVEQRETDGEPNTHKPVHRVTGQDIGHQ